MIEKIILAGIISASGVILCMPLLRLFRKQNQGIPNEKCRHCSNSAQCTFIRDQQSSDKTSGEK